MPITVSESVIHLIDHCAIEEVEALHEELRTIEQPIFDLAEVASLHTAIVQLIMLTGGAIRSLPPDPVLTACFRGQRSSS
jgi:hypothetical protein